ncbi:hypothetical protein pb186bvf_013358 [Paramecium bursaria]
MKLFITKREKLRYYTAYANLLRLKIKQKGQEEQIIDPSRKQIYMAKDLYEQKLQSLEQKIKELEGPENKNKRKRIYYELAYLKNSQLIGRQFNNIDISEINRKKDQDKERRLSKKLAKKKLRIQALKTEKMRAKHKICLVCKKKGHVGADCRENVQQETICYNCGQNDHTLKECPKPRGRALNFASCFVCKKTGHISRDCPDNPKGLYVNGGGCYICNGTTHVQKDCPKNPSNKIRVQREQEELKQYFSD